MFNVFTLSYYIPGTLAANHVLEWIAPFDCQLIHAQAHGSNANDATLMLGSSSDTDAYMSATAIGDSDAPAEWDRDNFIGTQFPHIADGTIVVLTLDYDGSSGTAAQNVCICLTFTVG
jgi:hypothetical protein